MATQYTAGITNGQVWSADIANSIGAAWESYTPTLTQSGTVTKTVVYAKYTQINKLCIANVRLDVTGTGTGNNPVLIGLPLTSATSQLIRFGSCMIYDASAATRYTGVVELSTTTTVALVGDWSGQLQFGQNPNIALANGDQLGISVMYEVA